MAVRRAKTGDLSRIRDLLGQVLRVHAELRPDLFSDHAVKYSDEEILSILEDPATPVFVYENAEGLVCGYVFCVRKEPPAKAHLKPLKTLFIDDFCVEKTCRGKKVGQTLYEYVRAYAKKEGFDRITLNVWNANLKAYGFYEAMGLKPLETIMEDLL
ncbi:MAG: GNAT family N-acetyltransferase [Erysipelotrichales bacterium]|nr:GNAT family N-acetyltransferase [Erysipelotrichales bacterium]